MAGITIPLSDMLFVDDVFSKVSSQQLETFQSIGTVAISLILFSLVLVAAVTVAFVVTAALSPRNVQEGSYDFGRALGIIALYLGAMLAPIAAFFSAVRRLIAQLLQFFLSNALLIIGALLVGVVAWVWTAYYPVLLGALIRGYELTLVPLWRVVPLYIMMLVRLFIEGVYPWINAFVVRIPSSLFTGIFFDSATCARDTWTLLMTSIVEAWIELANAIAAWTLSGDAALTIPPDFGVFGQKIASSVFTLNAFVTCMCSSGAVIVTPFFSAFSEGNPTLNSTIEPIVPFACAVNSTVNLPFTLVMDVMRPVKLYSAAIANGDTFLDAVRGSQANFNSTIDNARNVLNCTLAFATNVVQQYFVLIIGDTTNTSAAFIPGPGPPPVLFECATGLLWSPIELLKYVINILTRLESTFTTFDGQLHWYLDGIADSLRDTIYCICQLIGWFADVMRAIGDDIKGAPGQCDGTTGGDLGGAIGGCIFYIIGAVFDFVCCFAVIGSNIALELLLLFFEYIVGTLYIFVSRIDDASDTRCLIVEPEDAFYCSIYRNPALYLVFDYLSFQTGSRRPLTGVPPQCPAEICSLPKCSTDADCTSSPLYGVAARCDLAYGRCLDTVGSCNANVLPVFPATNCLSNPAAGMRSLGKCSGFVCPGPIIDATFPQNCRCPSDQVRDVLTLFITLAECIGRLFLETFGPGAETIRCFLVRIVELFVEFVDFFFDLAAQFGIIIDMPALLDVSTRELVRSVLGICDCLARMVVLFGTPAPGNTSLNKLVATIETIIRCACDIGVLVFDVLVVVVEELVNWFRSGTLPDAFLDAFDLIIKAIIDLIGLAFYFGAAIFYAMSAVPPGAPALRDVGDALGPGKNPPSQLGAGAFIKLHSYEAAAAVADILEFVAACIGGLIVFAFKLFACIADLAIGESDACEDLFASLLPCLEAIGNLIILIIDWLCGGCVSTLTCIIKFVGCFIGLDAQDLDGLCIDTENALFISDELCAAVNVACLAEEALCFLFIPVDFGCDTFNCPNRPIWCVVWDIACGVDLILFNVLSFINKIFQKFVDFAEKVANFFRKFACFGCGGFNAQNDPDCVEECSDISLNDANILAGYPFVYQIKDKQGNLVLNNMLLDCCIDNAASNTSANITVFKPTLLCFNESFVKVRFINDNANHNCIVEKRFACFIHLTDQEIFDTAFSTTCCQSTTGQPECAPGCCPSRKRELYSNETLLDYGAAAAAAASVRKRAKRVLDNSTENGLFSEFLSSLPSFDLSFDDLLDPYYSTTTNPVQPHIPAEDMALIGTIERPGQLSSPETMATLCSTADVLGAIGDAIVDAPAAVPTFGMARACIQFTGQSLVDVDLSVVMWPPLEHVAQFDSMWTKFVVSSCVHYLNEYLSDVNVQNRLTAIVFPDHPYSVENVKRDFVSTVELSDEHAFAGPFMRFSVLNPKAIIWPLTYSLSLGVNTMRLLMKYASASDVQEPPRMTTLGFIGTAAFSTRPENCRASTMPAAILADLLTPVTGTLLRASMRALRTSLTQLRAMENRLDLNEHTPLVRSIVSLLRMTGNMTRQMQEQADFATGVAEFGTLLTRGARVTLKRASNALPNDLPSFRDIQAASRIITQPRTPAAALARHRLAVRLGTASPHDAHDIALETTLSERRAQHERTSSLARQKRWQSELELELELEQSSSSEQDTTSESGGDSSVRGGAERHLVAKRQIDGELSTWAAQVMQRADERLTLMMRESMYGTTNLGEIQALLAERALNGDCDIRASPFVCCPGQNVCTECSFLDRVLWAGQNSFDCITEYYSGDFRSRFLPCIEQDAITANRIFIPLAQRCPGAICAAPECTSDADCVLSAAGDNSTATVCNPTFGRCLIEGNSQCAGADVSTFTCFTQSPGNACNVGQCNLGACGTTASFDCDCSCPDTFLTEDKVVPWLFTRLANLQLPCLFNISCLLDTIVPPGFNTTTPDTHEFQSSWFAIKTRGDLSTPNIDVSTVLSLNVFNNLGFSIIGAIEDIAYQIANVGESSNDIAANFLNEYLFCDYKDDWFCPLTDASPEGCCSDRCEIRRQGTNLFNGIVFALIALAVPLAVVALCPLFGGCTGLLTMVWVLIAIPLVMMLSYGGGFLCYLPGPSLILVPFLPLAIAAITGIVSLVLNLTGGLLTVATCGFIPVNLDPIVSGLRIVLRAAAAFLTIFAFFPALSVCTGLDLYTVASEIIPTCFPLPPLFIDRAQPGSTIPCGAFLDSSQLSVLPTIINCATSPQLPATRFLDGLDNLLYLVEQVDPGFNEKLATATETGVFSFLNTYALAHTEAAHNASMPPELTAACFYMTLPSILWSTILLLLQLFLTLLTAGAALFILALLFLPLFWAGYAVWFMLDAIKTGWIYRFDPDDQKIANDPDFMAGQPDDGYGGV